MKKITVFADGVAREKSGPATIEVRILEGEEGEMAEFSESIGNAVSSYAGYYAVLRALQFLTERFGEDTATNQYELKLKDEAIVKQLNAESPITEPSLVPLFIEIHNMRVTSFPKLTLLHVQKV